MEQLREFGLLTATVATTLATYLLFSSFFPVVVQRLKKSKFFYLKGLHTFTFAQLHFRMNELKRILATVAMLIALSAGAISGGFAFLNNANPFTEEMNVYDVKVYDMSQEEKDLLAVIPFTDETTYRFKLDNNHIYFSATELNNDPPLIRSEIDYTLVHPKKMDEKADLELNDWGQQTLTDEWESAISTISPSVFLLTKIVPKSEFDRLPLTTHSMYLGKTDEFKKHKNTWAEIDQIQQKRYEEFGEDNYYYSSKYSMYQEYLGTASGTFFMGFFLGTAFLMMMASILMFKILSGAHQDIHRYESLRKIGVTHRTLSASVAKELGIVFLFPGILGIVHVLVGMNLFSFILIDPYYKLWVSILLFLAIYVLYYLITVSMYRKIVLPKT
ncbi:hypothetical protein NCCP2222_25410 [Sporosarcina sp. NCCP-2222]|uniref:ABC transporter permease n=1 Tax=Sporosarcina sp. NCCP-2222 TaxID=2935073 RepID=UPI002085B2B3|nr:FtsX-like permease family protein [Sporosarcina sp. NCCP-2222]GKV56594.1 hypothetical protein NCCP2222_25410 [Sporosarcina sp. NCCP-2222]